MSSRSKALLWAALPLLLLTPAMLWMGGRYRDQLVADQRIRTQHTLGLNAQNLQRSLDRIDGKLESLAAFAASQPSEAGVIDPLSFRTFAAGLHASSEWIRAFQIVCDGVITHTYPLKGNEAVLGYDLMADPRPVIGGDARRAVETGRTTVTGPIDLIQGGLGIIIRRPLKIDRDGAARLVAVVLNISPLLAESGITEEGSPEIRLAIRREAGEAFFGPSAVFESQPIRHRLSLPEGYWEMGAIPYRGWSASDSRPVVLFHAAGAVITALLSLLVFNLAYRQASLKELVQERTATLQVELAARRAAEEEMRRGYSLLQAVAEGTSDAVFVKDRDGRYQMINPAGARFFGQTPESVLGKTDLQLLSPDGAAAIMKGDREVMATGRVHTLEERGTAAGVTRTYQATKAPWRDGKGAIIGVVGVSRDITQRKETEAALQESETRYRFLFQHNPMPMLIYERSTLQLLAVNEAFTRHYGYSDEEARRLHLPDLYPEEEKEGIVKLAARLHGHANAGEWRHRRKDGSFITIVAHSHDISYEGRNARVAVMTDITERKRAEQELRSAREHLEQRVEERTAELAVAKDRAESADRLKSAFLATMSHELRTPLNSIIGFTGILLQGLAGPLNPEQTKQMGMVQSSARHLLALISDVLDLSKIEAGQLSLRREEFNLRSSLETVVDLIRPLAQAKGLAVRTQLPTDLGTVLGDRMRVEQVVLNLLSNSVKYTERGEVLLAADRPAEDPSSPGMPAPAMIRLRVSDTGIGIKAEDLGGLFQPFHQVDAGLTRLREGTGLGLAICQRLAHLMEGRITVESEWGRGSTFTFHLPVAGEARP